MAYESLEARYCLSFQFDLIAETASTNLTRIEDFVSLNDSGKVSFIAHDNNSSGGVFVGEAGKPPKLVSFPSGTAGSERNYGRASSINDEPTLGQHKVAARDLNTNSAHSFLRQWSTTSSQPTFEMVAVSKNVPLSLKEPEIFDSLSSFVDINDLNQIVFVGLDSSTGSTVQKLRIRDSVVNAAHGWSIEVGDFPASAAMRPQISNSTEVVFRSPLGPSIFKTDRNSSNFRTLAGAKEGFVDVGRSPGISDDGRVVVFYGDHPFDNQPHDGLGGGPGIFASILKPGGDPNGGSASRMLVRLAGRPGELGKDPFGNPLALSQFATHSSITGLSTTDSRVGVAGSLSYDKDSHSRFYATFLANDPLHNNRETLWLVEFTAFVNGRGELTVSAGRPKAVTSADARIVDRSGTIVGRVADLELYDPINDKGQIAFWARLDSGSHAVVVASKLRNPVLVVPGIAGTFSDTNFLQWLRHRGESPTNLKIDPLGRLYDNMIETLKRAGYKEGEDLFIATYDWRVLPGPIDGANLDPSPSNWNFDGYLPNIRQRISPIQFEYGVDYFLYWLQAAVNAWEAKHPGLELEAVDVIAHSTGGLVTRSYIQSDAYGADYLAPFGRMVSLPMVDKFVMVGVPNRGATKAWNPLKDNFKNDPAFRFVLSKVIKDAFIKQKTKPISNPDGTEIFQETDPVAFINRYIPTIRSLLATYKFLLRDGTLQSVNDLPHERNNLLLDLNAGLDIAPNGDANRFADLVGQVINVFGTNASETPFTVREQTGPVAHLSDPLFPFMNLALAQEPGPFETWWEEQSSTDNGDGTVPLISTRDQFAGDARIKQLPFTTGARLSNAINTTGNVGHTGLLSNPDVQAAILAELGQPIARARISTTINIPAGHNFKSIFLDPVEGFLVDGLGRRLGYSTATGIVTEIPDSVYIGDQDGMGWIFGPVVAPLTLQLSGVGEDHFAEVAGIEGTTSFSVDSQGFLAVGETRSLSVVDVINYAPVALDDDVETATALVIDVLANDSDLNGDALTLSALDSSSLVGQAQITGGKISYTPRAGFDGIDTLRYTVSDGRGGAATATVRIAVPGRPRILAITPTENAEVGSLSTIWIDFSHRMDVASTTDTKHYRIVHEILGVLNLASVTYADQGDVHRATLTLSAAALVPGRVNVYVDGRALRTAAGHALNGIRDNLLVVTPDDNGQLLVTQDPDGSFQTVHQGRVPGHDRPAVFQLVDWNSDKLLDVILVSSSTSEILVYAGLGGHAFAPPTRIKLPPTATGLAANPVQLQVADWNQDQIPDLIVYDYVNDYWQGEFKRILVYLNDGRGGLSVAPDTPIPLDRKDLFDMLVVADFTGDGLLDVAVGGPVDELGHGSVAIYAKDPFLGYSRVRVLSTNEEWYPVTGVTGDFNGDGRPDLIVNTAGHFAKAPGIVVYYSTSTGIGAGQVLEFDGIGSGGLGVGDFTGDGKLDLAILHDHYSRRFDVFEGSVISFLEGTGQGHFIEHPQQVLGRRGIVLAGVADLNRDGKLDLLTTAVPWDGTFDGFPNLDYFSTWSFLGDGKGEFRPATPDPVRVAPFNTSGLVHVAVGDVNGDGFAEAVIGSVLVPEMRIPLNDRTGVLRGAAVRLPTGTRLNQPPDSQFRRLVDFDGDGIVDLLVLTGEREKQLVVYRGTVDGEFELVAVHAVPAALSVAGLPGNVNYGWLTTGDFNNDGRLDVIVGSDTRGVIVMLGQGNGQFAPTTHLPIYISGSEYLGQSPGAVVDVNRDGNLDLLVTVQNPSGWAIYFGDGTGQLTYNQNSLLRYPAGFSEGAAPDATPPLRDLDGDGKVDLLVAIEKPDDNQTHLTMYRGVGNGTFTLGPVSVIPRAFYMTAYAFQDFNGDGKLDALGYWQGNAWREADVELFVGDGTGRFQHLAGATQAFRPYVGTYPSILALLNLQIGDFNGDGAPDVSATRLGHNEVALFLNDRSGRFAEPILHATPQQPRTLQPVAERQWVDTGTFLVAATLWPVKVTSPEKLPLNQPIVKGTGPAEATVRLLSGATELKRTTADSEGVWALTLPAGLSLGKHLLKLVASDNEGRISAETQTVVEIVPAAKAWQNPRNPLDVSDDSKVTNFDLVLLLRELGAKGSYRLPAITDTTKPPPYYDVFGDDLLTVADATQLLRFLGQRNGSSEPAGEAPSPLALDPNMVDAVWDSSEPFFTPATLRRRLKMRR